MDWNLRARRDRLLVLRVHRLLRERVRDSLKVAVGGSAGRPRPATYWAAWVMSMACCVAWSTLPRGAATAGFRLISAQMVVNWFMYDANASCESSPAFFFVVMKFLKFCALCTCSPCGTLKMVDRQLWISWSSTDVAPPRAGAAATLCWLRYWREVMPSYVPEGDASAAFACVTR